MQVETETQALVLRTFDAPRTRPLLHPLLTQSERTRKNMVSLRLQASPLLKVSIITLMYITIFKALLPGPCFLRALGDDVS